VLKDAPLNVTLLPQFSVSLDSRCLESIHQEPGGLIEELKPVSQFAGSKRVSTVYRWVQRRATRFALIVLVLTPEKQELVRIRISESCHMLHQGSERSHVEGGSSPDGLAGDVSLQLRR
jgi:hypothetical protein